MNPFPVFSVNFHKALFGQRNFRYNGSNDFEGGSMQRLLIALLSALFCMIFAPSALADSSEVTMLCLNVGKADCILLTVENHRYLIDTGYKRTSDLLLDMLAHENVDHLDGVFLTHNHKDHYGGLNALCSSGIPVDAFYTSAYCADGTGSKHPAVIAAAKRGQNAVFLKSGNTIQISDTARFDILAPMKLDTKNENNNSLVIRLDTNEGSILLTGDMKFEEEYQLLKSGLLTPTDVLKVPFHGDNTATSSSFLSAIKPKVGIISTSTKEEKDTPSRDTLFRLASIGCKVYVTQDAASAIRVTLSGGNITVGMENWNDD